MSKPSVFFWAASDRRHLSSIVGRRIVQTPTHTRVFAFIDPTWNLFKLLNLSSV